MGKRSCVGCIAVWLSMASWSATAIEGRVFLDTDGDGQPGAAEPGIADVAVSNGRAVVRTDPQGRYGIDLVDGETLFVIKPAGYAVPSDARGLPRFWSHQTPAGSPVTLRYGGLPAQQAQADFSLLPASAAAGGDALDLLVFGDPQPKTLTDVDYYRRDIVEPLRGRHTATLGLSLGDIVHDDLSLYPALTAVTTQLGVPWLHVPGNHDLDFDAPSDAHSLDSFRAFFGPDSFAWEESQAVFIVLDDVIFRPGEYPEYVGGLRESQFQFLEAYLAGLSLERWVVVAVHIPLFNTHPRHETFRAADRQRLFKLLQRFPRRLILSAHSHAQQHVFHDRDDGWLGDTPLHEYNVGAACGGYWSGITDASGIPDASMADGTPNGYAELRLPGTGDYHLRWRPAREPEDAGMRLHAPKLLRRGAYPGVSVYANVFMADADSRVEARIGDGDWRPMRRVEEADPFVQSHNLLDDAASALRGFDRLPQAEPSSHLWRMPLPTDLEAGEHEIEVRVQDRWRGELRASTRYRLVDWP